MTRKNNGQAIIEFTFAMIVIALLIFGMVKVFQWTGLSLAEQRIQHDVTLVNQQRLPGQTKFQTQVDEDFARPMKMNAAFREFDFKDQKRRLGQE